MNYRELKQLSKDLKSTVKNLIALAPQNDPFYVGAPAQVASAEWFAGLWKQFEFPYGVHLRRIHYQLISQENKIIMSNGKEYLNTIECWKALNEASKAARYLNLVDINAFDDRRNPPPVIYEPALQDVSLQIHSEVENYFDIMDVEMPDLPSIRVEAPQVSQRYMVEVWCEKSTMNDILEPLCRRYGANLVTGLGELSITAVNLLDARIRQSGKPVRILYLSDFDPAGRSMPVAVSRKCEYLMSGCDVKLFPIVLTPEQVQEYRLPRTPIKESEMRKNAFESRYGTGATELDALEALHPGKLTKIVSKAIEHYRDESLVERVHKTVAGIRSELMLQQAEVYRVYANEIAEAESEWQAIKNGIENWRLKNERLWQVISEDLSEQIINDIELPESEEADELPGALFDSDRDYMEQLGHYKAFQGKKDL